MYDYLNVNIPHSSILFKELLKIEWNSTVDVSMDVSVDVSRLTGFQLIISELKQRMNWKHERWHS